MITGFKASDIFLSIGGKEIRGGRIEISTDPTTVAGYAVDERSYPVIWERDIDSTSLITIITIEVNLGSIDYYILYDLQMTQRNNPLPPHVKGYVVVFNDRLRTKLVSNYGIFCEKPTRNYTTEPDKITFEIRCAHVTESIPEDSYLSPELITI